MNHLQITGVAISREENNTAAPAASGREREGDGGLQRINCWKQESSFIRQKTTQCKVTLIRRWGCHHLPLGEDHFSFLS